MLSTLVLIIYMSSAVHYIVSLYNFTIIYKISYYWFCMIFNNSFIKISLFTVVIKKILRFCILYFLQNKLNTSLVMFYSMKKKKFYSKLLYID